LLAGYLIRQAPTAGTPNTLWDMQIFVFRKGMIGKIFEDLHHHRYIFSAILNIYVLAF